MQKLSISIILCTHQRCEGLKATLNSLAQIQVPAGDSIELLVIENGAQDGTREVVGAFKTSKLSIRYLYIETKSKSRALNEGIRRSTGEVLIFIDDDLVFPSEWLVSMAQPIRDLGYSAVAGGIVIPEHLKRPWMTDYHMPWLGSTTYLSRESPSEVAGANFAVHRRVFERVEGFDEQLGGGGLGNCEDSRFGRDLRKAGFDIFPQFECCVEHHFQPEKLLYGNWVKAAESAGRSKAYLEAVIEGKKPAIPALRGCWLGVKLGARMALSRKHVPEDEGISAWELSYRSDRELFRNHARLQRKGHE